MTIGPIRRPHYFAGEVLSADDLAQEQDYFLKRLRRHNRELHGSGVVRGLGLKVETQSGSPTLIVSAGYALTPAGDEIVVCEPVTLPIVLAAGRSVVVIRYEERLVEPVPAVDGVEYRTVEETFAIELLAPDAPLDDQSLVLGAVQIASTGQAFVDVAGRRELRRG